MLGREAFSEILDSLSKNKLRTVLTGFAVAWGIFIFVVLLGMGNGVQNAMNNQFSSDAINKIKIGAGQTSMEYKGLRKGRRIKLYEEDALLLNDYFDESKGYNTSVWLPSKITTYKDKNGSYTGYGLGIKGQSLENTTLLQGRMLNAIDLKDRRKVVVLSEKPYKELLGDGTPIEGKYIHIDKMPFQVVGVVKYKNSWNNDMILLPITTAQQLYNSGNSRVHRINLVIDATLQGSKKIEERIRQVLGGKYDFSKDDRRAVWTENNIEEYARAQGVIQGIKLFILLIGVLTLLSGITGISNIMLISVKERTKEIGVRKALGAKPRSIVQQIIFEAIFITAIAGYIGLVIGTLVVELVNFLLKNAEASAIKNPTVDLQTAIIATSILVISGAIAGWLPARKAAKIKPIEALRYE